MRGAVNGKRYVQGCHEPEKFENHCSRAVVPNPLCATERFNVRQYFQGPAFKGSVSCDRDKRLDMRQE